MDKISLFVAKITLVLAEMILKVAVINFVGADMRLFMAKITFVVVYHSILYENQLREKYFDIF